MKKKITGLICLLLIVSLMPIILADSCTTLKTKIQSAIDLDNDGVIYYTEVNYNSSYDVDKNNKIDALDKTNVDTKEESQCLELLNFNECKVLKNYIIGLISSQNNRPILSTMTIYNKSYDTNNDNRIDSSDLLFNNENIDFCILRLNSIDENELSGETGLIIDVFGSMVCNIGRNNWSDYRTSPASTRRSNGLAPEANCKFHGAKDIALKTTTDFCCPEGTTCTETNLDETSENIANGWPEKLWRCEKTEKVHCFQFNRTSEAECEKNNGNPIVANKTFYDNIDLLPMFPNGKRSVCGDNTGLYTWDEGSKRCYNQTDCTCVWDSAINKCNTHYESNKKCYDIVCGNCGSTKTINYNCTWERESGDDGCSAGKSSISITWIAHPADPAHPAPGCEEGTRKTTIIDCSNVIMMDFFDGKMFIISLIALIIIYAVYLIYNKEQR